MSSTAQTAHPRPVSDYTGPDRYAEWAKDYLNVELSAAQKEIMRAVTKHRHLHIESGNGLGKSYTVACLALAFLYTNHPATVYATSGTYPKLRRTLCRPIKKLQQEAKDRYRLPGTYKESPPRIEFHQDPEHYFEAARPKDPDELEGPHNEHLLAIIEEADKDGVTEEVIEAMDSTLTDANDRIIAIGNPPRDESNVVHDLSESDEWHTIQFSTFDSRNVRAAAGWTDAPTIPGLVGLSKVEENWREWNDEEWPGIDEAQTIHNHRDDLDIRWYRRRAGVMPPAGADAHRPFTIEDVRSSFEASIKSADDPAGLGMDVARSGGDSNVIASVHNAEQFLAIMDRWSGVDHNDNEVRVRKQLGDGWDAPFPVDANGEGSGLADRISTFYPDLYRYDSGSEPEGDATEYYACWDEALYCLGQFLKAGGTFANRRLREELLAAARVVEYEEKFYKSRDSTVLKASSKDDVKEHLGRSPDCLDAAMMAVWARDVQPTENPDPYAYSFN